MRTHFRSFILLLVLALFTGACEIVPEEVQASSGVQAVSVDNIQVNTEGFTIEQQNIADRLTMDNAVGAIKHLYVISAWSGDVLLYSTVRGKVTSSGKRLTPTSVAAMDGQYIGDRHEGLPVRLGNEIYSTGEVLQDDGTYGSSIPYLYWWDAQGQSHQHYPSGGQILHISDQPITVGDVRISLSIDTGN